MMVMIINVQHKGWRKVDDEVQAPQLAGRCTGLSAGLLRGRTNKNTFVSPLI